MKHTLDTVRGSELADGVSVMGRDCGAVIGC
jgi:hypothetical protein